MNPREIAVSTILRPSPDEGRSTVDFIAVQNA